MSVETNGAQAPTQTEQAPAQTSSGTGQSSTAFREEPTIRSEDEAASDVDFGALADEPDESWPEEQTTEAGMEKPDAGVGAGAGAGAGIEANAEAKTKENTPQAETNATKAGEKPAEAVSAAPNGQAGEKPVEAAPVKAGASEQSAEQQKPEQIASQAADAAATPALTPEQQKEAYDKWFDESVGKIADEYQMSDEEYAEYEADPRVALPKLAAKVTIKAIEAVAANTAASFPQLFNQYAMIYQSQQRDLDDFYTAWPDLKDEQALDVVTRIGKMYRGMHPAASKEQYIKEVGAQAMFVLGRVKSDQDRAAEQGANGQGRVEAPVRLPSNAAPVTPARPAVTNVFEEMALDGDDAFG